MHSYVLSTLFKCRCILHSIANSIIGEGAFVQVCRRAYIHTASTSECLSEKLLTRHLDRNASLHPSMAVRDKCYLRPNGRHLTRCPAADFGAWYPRFAVRDMQKPWDRYKTDMDALLDLRLRFYKTNVLWRAYGPTHFGTDLGAFTGPTASLPVRAKL